jgi:hypothetical protein
MTTPASAAHVLLTVGFDVEQLTSLLHYKLERSWPQSAPRSAPDPDPDPEPRDGLYADSLHFGPGEQLSLELIGYGGGDVVGIEVVDACFVTRPKVLTRSAEFRTQFSRPSMFDQGTRATMPLSLDFSSDTLPYGESGSRTRLRWNDTLGITDTAGIWEVSFVLTVSVLRRDALTSEFRVFSFDPESEVGGPSTVK